MIFQEFHSQRGCMSYLVGCDAERVVALVDPSLDLLGDYRGALASNGWRLSHLIDTHTHADHFSAVRQLAAELSVPAVQHSSCRGDFVDLAVDDGETLVVGQQRIRIMHTPGHTGDSICLVLEDRVLTGDTLLLGACGRTDFPGGDAAALYDSLFNHLLKLDGSLLVYPGHNYKQKPTTTLEVQIRENPRLQQKTEEAFVAQMDALKLDLPDHLTEALRTNITGGKTVETLIRDAARSIAFVSRAELNARIESGDGSMVVLDVRERDAFAQGHIPGAVNVPRGQLELRADTMFPNPTVRIVPYCDFGKISTLATATLREMGFFRAVALDGGFDSWRQDGYRFES